MAPMSGAFTTTGALGAAGRGAVAMASEARTADVEDDLAPAAANLEASVLFDHDHRGEELDGRSIVVENEQVARARPRLARRGLRWRPGPSFFSLSTAYGA